MAAKPTEASCYESKFGGGYITLAQYLAEMMCQRKAATEGSTLPQKFWQLPAWKKDFALQVSAAKSVLAVYHSEVVLGVLQSREGSRVHSLKPQFFHDMLVKAQARWETQKEVAQTVAETQHSEQPPAADEACVSRFGGNTKKKSPFGLED